MDLATLIPLALKAGIALMVFVLGLSASSQDVTYLLRRPGLFLRSLLAMNVVMPLFAAAVVAFFHLNPAVKIALIALAVSPIPPMLPKRALKAGGNGSYTISLLAVAALLAIVFVPLAVDLLGRAFGRTTLVGPGAIVSMVAVTVLAPLAAGLLFRRLAPAVADRLARPLSLVAFGILVVAILPVLFKILPVSWSLIGDGTLAAIVAFVLVGLAVGHLLGGPEPEHRTVLALATACRHPGIALAIATATFPQQKLAAAAIVLYLLVNVIVCIPYMVSRQRRRASTTVPGGSAGHAELTPRTDG